MSKFAKFAYEHLSALGEDDAALKAPPRKRALTEAQIEDIRREAFAEGVKKGESLALAGIEMRAVEILDHIAARIPAFYAQIADQIDVVRHQAASLAMEISNALVPALIAREPLAEIEKLFGACVEHLKAEPRIVIRVEDQLIEPLKDKIEGIAYQAGYPGRIVLLGEPEFLPAQCQIEWSDGGVNHRSPEQQGIIGKILADYVAGYHKESHEPAYDPSQVNAYAAAEVSASN